MSNAPDHFSHSYELKIDQVPTQKSDRIALRILYPGLMLGLALVLLGLYELLNGFKNTKTILDDVLPADDIVYEPVLNPTFFDAVVILVGLGIMISLIFSYIRYKKILFDGKNVTVIHRPVFGNKKVFKEPLGNYEGVRFRIEFFQFGLLNKNKYIIELYNQDSYKTAPLYISTSNKHIRKIWEGYARKLNLPTLIMTDEGMASRDVEDLDKSIKEMKEKWHLENQFDERAPLPPSIAYVRKADKTVIKSRKIIWDAYNIIAWFIIITAALFLTFAITTYVPEEHESHWLIASYFTGAAILIGAVYALFRKDKIVIKPQKIIIVHKFMLFSRKKDELKKDDIESIDVTFNPATERYFVAIASDEKTLIFGKKLPIEDLRWVKKFLINEIIK